MFFAERNISFDAPGFNLVICPRPTSATLFSFLSTSEWKRYSTSCKREISPRLFRPQLHGHLPLSIICPRLFFVLFPAARASLSRNAVSHLHRRLSHRLVSLIDYAASFLFLKSKNQGQRIGSETLSTCRPFVPRPFDATNEPRLAMSHHLSSIAGNEHEYAYHPASTIFQRAPNANN